MTQPSCRGFTLLELLVALAVFAVVSMLAYGGLNSVLEARENTTRHALQLRALQQTFLLLQRDLEQFANRGIRNEYGDPLAALQGGEDWLEFTRAGWSNPTARPRSQLQRVAYALQDERLMRNYWLVLDRARDSMPIQAGLMDRVRRLQVRYLDENGGWQDSWPPLQQSLRTDNEISPPRAIEITLEHAGWGIITRLFKLP